MADINQKLRQVSREHGVRLDIVEKDYALSYLLSAIITTPDLDKRLVLKGGTALKKVYYADYRFSEDLDFSTLDLATAVDYTVFMPEVVQRMTALLNTRGPFQAHYEPLTLKQPHPDQQAAFLVRVQFPGQREPLCRLKIEITTDEPVLLPAEERPLLHSFDETLTVQVRVYALAEIVAEKLRALLQSRQRLAARGWGASRVCRDYYDLWAVLRREGHFAGLIPDLLQRKCQVRKVTLASPEDFLAENLLLAAQQEWQQQLLPFVPNAPPVAQILEELRPLIMGLWG